MPKSLYPDPPVLLVDDEEAWLHSFGLALRAAGINNIETCSDSRKVLDLVMHNTYSTIVLDLIMPNVTGEELLPRIINLLPEVPVIVLTGLDQVETAVACMKQGAYDYFTKVSEEHRLISGIKRAIDLGLLKRENHSLKDHFFSAKLNNPDAFADIVSANQSMIAIFRYMEAVAISREPVLITGETGVGKELIAKALHKLTGREGKFISVNIAGLDDNMAADTLFGHIKGAFTGAAGSRPGLIDQAAGGTLFLDEIGDLSPSTQIKLLRLLQEREYFPLGSDVPKRTDTRFIFATHRPAEDLKNSADFRQDLYFRLQTHHIHIPPLKERLDDLPLLVDHFLEIISQELHKKKPSYPRELILLLGTYSFPGNIRELKNILYDIISQHTGRMLSLEPFTKHVMPEDMPLNPQVSLATDNPFSEVDRLPSLKECSRLLISEALKRSNGNQTIAAQMLGITRQALNWRMNQQDGKN